jgi:hypothetical protein
VPRSKKGDFVVTLSQDSAAPGARIVVEAKEDASYRLPATLNEADEARANRGAALCVFVHSRKTAPATMELYARHAHNLVVVWDADDERTDVVLRAALACAKALSVRAARRSSVEAASMQRIDEAIAAITKQVEGLEEIAPARPPQAARPSASSGAPASWASRSPAMRRRWCRGSRR